MPAFPREMPKFAKLGFTEAAYDDENERLWAVLSECVKDHGTLGPLVESHVGKFAKAYAACQLWSIGNLADSKGDMKDQIDKNDKLLKSTIENAWNSLNKDQKFRDSIDNYTLYVFNYRLLML